MTTIKNISLLDAITERRSVRGYKPDCVPQDVLDELFTQAQKSPSNCNVQPWRVLLANGTQCDELREKMKGAFMKGQSMNPDFSALPKFEGLMRNRQMECAQALYGAMGIERGDRVARMQATARNYEFFNAPHIAFICMDRQFSPAIAVDVGMYAQTLMLLMTAYGIGSCAQASVAYYPDIIREYFNEPEETGILFGISFGYEDASVDANNARTNRADLSEIIKTV